MHLFKSLTLTVFILGSLAAPAQADDLESALKANGWDNIVGTWQEDDGVTISFAWKFPGKALESFTKWDESEKYSILWLKPKAGEIAILSTDNAGGYSQGTCTFGADKAVFKVTYEMANGRTGNKTTEYTLNGDTLKFRINGGEPRTLSRK